MIKFPSPKTRKGKVFAKPEGFVCERMKFNAEKYLPCMALVNIPLAQEEEILRVIWTLMEAQVDKAFGLHPVQCCGWEENASSLAPPRGLDSIKITTVDTFNRLASNDGSFQRKA